MDAMVLRAVGREERRGREKSRNMAPEKIATKAVDSPPALDSDAAGLNNSLQRT